jgi:signal transduction histidine kinase
MTSESLVDITPSPRILRTLGEIPFEPWQCLAELVDNSIDALVNREDAASQVSSPRITVNWSTDAVRAAERTVEVYDNGPGMSLETLTEAARAGYTSNDPINNLGLFGMGFNIATARLGERTQFLSTRSGDKEWVGLEIDFQDLISRKSFGVRPIRTPKSDSKESGTRIVVGLLKDGIFTQFRDKEAAIRRQLEAIYSPLLDSSPVEIKIQGKQLFPQKHCVWDSSRQSTTKAFDFPVPAVLTIDEVLGTALFDLNRGTYLSLDADADAREIERSLGRLPEGIVEREKRVRGWLGIQRYSDPNDFGIDFVRNGRKILIRNKDLFHYVNPLTGTSTLEYPVELGSTVGGRIVGVLNVDFLRPTYQKNDFDRSDLSWHELVTALRGDGPLLPRERKALGYVGPNASPIGRLATAYRRQDPGTKCLVIPRDLARDHLKRFESGETAFQDDTAWWRAAQDEDRQRATGGAGTSLPVDEGDGPSDDIDEYSPETTDGPGHVAPSTSGTQSGTPASADTSVDELIQTSTKNEALSRVAQYSTSSPFEIEVREVRTGHILENGVAKPSKFVRDGVNCRFFYDPSHTAFTSTTISPIELLSVVIAEQFNIRDNVRNIADVYVRLVERSMSERRLDKSSLYERASSVLSRIAEDIVEPLSSRADEAVAVIKESTVDVEEIVFSILDNPSLLTAFQDGDGSALAVARYATPKVLLRLIDRFPELLLDGKLFRTPYLIIQLDDESSTKRARDESRERLSSLVKDVSHLLNTSRAGTRTFSNRDEIVRCFHSLNSLEKEIVD